MRIISVKENPEYKEQIIAYLQKSWSEVPPEMYRDCVEHCITSPNPLPQWYALEKDDQLIGCAGLITNDFISRMDLYPWLVALFIDEDHRGNEYAQLLIQKVISDTQKMGFKKLYLKTDHIGLYEKYGWIYIGDGYEPEGTRSRIYEIGV